MKDSLKQLTPNDRETLVHLYDLPDYKVLLKLLAIQKTELAKAHVGQLEMGQVRYLTGQVASLNWVEAIVRDNFKSTTKLEQKG